VVGRSAGVSPAVAWASCPRTSFLRCCRYLAETRKFGLRHNKPQTQPRPEGLRYKIDFSPSFVFNNILGSFLEKRVFWHREVARASRPLWRGHPARAGSFRRGPVTLMKARARSTRLANSPPASGGQGWFNRATTQRRERPTNPRFWFRRGGAVKQPPTPRRKPFRSRYLNHSLAV
jgi:hypothetical protein